MSVDINPHALKRSAQKDKCVWYAAYDEDMCEDTFYRYIHKCTDTTYPVVMNKGFLFAIGNKINSYGRIRFSLYKNV